MKKETEKFWVIVIALPLLFIKFAYAIEVHTEPSISDIYMAEINENITIYTQKYTADFPFTIIIKNIEFLKKRGTAFVKAGDFSDHDNVLVTLSFNNHTIWDVNDTQGTNISIYDNSVYDLQFKSKYAISEDILIFSLKENDTKKRIDWNFLILLFLIFVATIFLIVLSNHFIEKRKKDVQKGNNLR